jgi:hypothetical protein
MENVIKTPNTGMPATLAQDWLKAPQTDGLVDCEYGEKTPTVPESRHF